MTRRLDRRWFVPLVVGVVGLVADQVSKFWVVQTLGPETLLRAIPLMGDWFRIVYSHNTGIAFGLFQGMPQFFTLTALLISAGAVYVYWAHLPNRDPLLQCSLGLILAGAFGNVIDRIRLGYVIDFIQVGWWPVFNLADSAVFVGAALLAWRLARIEADQSSQEQATAQ